MKLKKLKIYLEAPCGAVIGEVQRDAILQSMEYNCNIEFVFNGKKYEYIFNDLMACCNTEERI